MKKLVLVLAALFLVAALAACGSSQTSNEDQGGQEGQRTAPEDVQVAPDEGGEDREEPAEAPEDTTLTLTVPKMERISNVEIPYGEGNNDDLFAQHAAVHLKGTGFPWEQEANVYIAGHRLGFPNTDSYLAFYDLEELQNGDEILLEDANGTEYTYTVFEKLVVEPTDVYVTEPIEGKNVVSLQSCTLPDYSDRVIIRGELQS